MGAFLVIPAHIGKKHDGPIPYHIFTHSACKFDTLKSDMLEYTEQPLTPKVGEIEFNGVQNSFVLTVAAFGSAGTMRQLNDGCDTLHPF